MYVSKSPEETEKVVKKILSKINAGESAALVALSGELGAGKTAFVKFAASHFGVRESVASPTFVIEKIYKLKNQKFSHLVHVDAYRLESGAELAHLGFSEVLQDPGNIIFLEWPENVSDVLPERRLNVKMKFIDRNTRSVEIENRRKAQGARRKTQNARYKMRNIKRGI